MAGESDPIDYLQLAREIQALHEQMNSEVRARQYERAALLRDQRERLQHKLQNCGNPTLLHNIKVIMSQKRWTLASKLEPPETNIDDSLLRKLEGLRLPVRWVIANITEPPIGTLRERVDIESIDSPYFMAKFPVISPASLRNTTKSPAPDIHVWIDDLARETALSETPVIWVCPDLDWLAPTGVFERWRELFQHRDFQFVACVNRLDSPRAAQLIGFQGVTVVEA